MAHHSHNMLARDVLARGRDAIVDYGRILRPLAQYFPGALDFDGTTDRQRGVGVTGEKDTALWTFSSWFNLEGGYATQRSLFSCGSSAFFFAHIAANQKVRISGKKTGGGEILRLDTSTLITAPGWHHVYGAGDHANGISELYLDGVSDNTEVVFDNDVLNTNKNNWDFAARNGANDEWFGKIGPTWFDFAYWPAATYLEKFRKADGSPAYLGVQGELPTGAQPWFCAPDGDATAQIGSQSSAAWTTIGAPIVVAATSTDAP